jgi:thiamine pyrophosphate-dependent acetolactate synthase large subunit-like protein
MLDRADALKRIANLTEGVPCIVSVGGVFLEWDKFRPSDGNFPLNTLGSGSSVGLGMALSLPRRKILVLDGDGAVLMNVNGLITVGRTQPENLIHVVFDNKIYESSGRVPTATAYNCSLTTIARGAGIKSVHDVDTVDGFHELVRRAFAEPGPHFIVAATAASGEDTSTNYPRLEEPDKKYSFIRWLEALEDRKIRENAIDVKLSLQAT